MESELGHDPSVWKRVGAELGWTAVAIPEACGGLGLSWVEVVALQEVLGEALFCGPYLATVGPRRERAPRGGRRRAAGRVARSHRRGRTRRSHAPCGARERRGRRDRGRRGRELPARRRRLRARRRRAPRRGRPLRRAARGRGAGRAGRLAVRHARGRARPRARAASHRRPHAPARRAPLRRRARARERSARRRRRRRPRARARARARRHRARRRAGGRRAALARPRRRLREGARPVRAPDRLLPGHQAQVRRHDGEARGRAFGRLLGRLRGGRSGCAGPPARGLGREGRGLRGRVLRAGNALQIFGGVGFTAEYDVQLYFKRARASAALLGDPAWHRERVAQRIGLDAGL